MIIFKRGWNFIKGFIILNIIWYVCALTMNSRILPSPDKVYIHMFGLLKNGFYIHIVASLYRITIGLLISFIIGCTIGLLMGYSKKLNSILNPLVYFAYPIPKTALLPVVMTLYGLGDGSKITIIVLITVFQIIVSVRDAVINVEKINYNPLISLGASKIQLFYHVTFPAILSEVLTNIRISIGTAFSVLFFAEAYGTSVGIGYFIQDSWTRINYLDMYSGIVVLSILGLILFIILDYLEVKLCSWKK